MSTCPRHGNSSLFVCAEAAAAVRQGAACPGVERREYHADGHPELVLRCWLCPVCVTRFGHPPSVALAQEDEPAR